MIIRIKNLRLRTIIGIYDWEKEERQDVIVNAVIEAPIDCAALDEDIERTINYKDLTKQLIDHVEGTSYELIETLTDRLCDLVLEDRRIAKVTIEVDKPHALRFADSVSVALTKTQKAG